MKHLLTELLLVLISVLAATLLVMLGLYVAHYPAHLVMLEWFKGSIGWPLDFSNGLPFDLAVSLKNATPLILTGLAAGIAFRCGVINIGAEGQALFGALSTVTFATILAPHLPSAFAVPLALLAGMLGGGLWALIAALLDRTRGVPIVLSTILLNFIALQLLKTFLEPPHGLLKDPAIADSQSLPLPPAFHLPTVPFASGLHIGIFIAVAIALLAWLLQSRTIFGFELRVTGLNPIAARLAGIPVASRQLSVMLLSGACAGLAGTLQLLGITHVLSTSSPGIGYTGIAVALLGRLHPVGIILAALFFGLLDQGATNVEISDYPLPHDVANIVKGIIVLAILIGAAFIARRRTRAQESV